MSRPHARCLFPPGAGSRARHLVSTPSRGAASRRLAAFLAGAVLAGAVLAALGGACSHPAMLPAPDGPPARPDCGGAPVLALGAPQVQRAYGVPAMLALLTIISRACGVCA